MITKKFTEQEYELLEMLEDQSLVPAKDADGNDVDEVDPRMRVIEAQLDHLINDFNADAAIRMGELSDELVARNRARIQYAEQISASARAGIDASVLLVNLLETMMLETGLDEAKSESMHLKIYTRPGIKRWVVSDARLVPDEFWHRSDERFIDMNAITVAQLQSPRDIPGVTEITEPDHRGLRRR